MAAMQKRLKATSGAVDLNQPKEVGSIGPKQTGGVVTPNTIGSGYSRDNMRYSGHGYGQVGGQTVFDRGDKSGAAFRDNLQTNFQGRFDRGQENYDDYSGDSDADVREAQRLVNLMSAGRAGLDNGFSYAVAQAQLDAALNRIGLKNTLGSQIKQTDSLMNENLNVIKSESDRAAKEGVKNTRRNFNRRGLLYSGAREGSEQSVKGRVASQMAQDMSATRRDFSNTRAQKQAAYAAIGQAQQAEKLAQAEAAFETATRNSVARAQAYQQLGQGIGSVAGSYYGSQGSAAGSGTQNPSTVSTVRAQPWRD